MYGPCKIYFFLKYINEKNRQEIGSVGFRFSKPTSSLHYPDFALGKPVNNIHNYDKFDGKIIKVIHTNDPH